MLILASHFFNTNKWGQPSLQKEASRIQQVLNEKETLLETKVNELSKATKNEIPTDEFSNLHSLNLFQKQGIILLIYENEELKFWSDNSVPIINKITPRRNYELPLQKLSNGWYLSKTLKDENRTIVGLLLLKNEYPFENKYLTNNFNSCFNVSKGIEISLEKTKKDTEIFTGEGTYLFSLVQKDNSSVLHIHDDFSIVLFICGLCFLILFFYRLFDPIPKIRLIIFSVVVLLIRAMMLYFQYPVSLYSLPIFDPAYHASSALFPSLGDFLLNILTIALLVFYFTENIIYRKLWTDNKYLKFIFGFGILVFALSLHFPISFLFKRLIVDSDIEFTINNLFSLNFFSYVGLFITWLLMLIWFLIFRKVAQFLAEYGVKEKIFFYFIALLIFVLITIISGATDWGGTIITAIIYGGFLFFNKQENNSNYVFYNAALILVFSVYSAYSLTHFDKEKAGIKARFYAEKLAAQQDPIAEYIFSEVSDEIQKDRLIRNQITLLPQNQEDFFFRIEQKFLNDYLQKYKVRINVFNTDDSLIASNNKLERTFDFYKTLELSSKPTSAKSLLYCYETNDELNYLGKLEFYSNREDDQKQTTIFIEFEEIISKNELGFPELLLDNKVDDDNMSEDYSFAVYRDGKIVSANGEFTYSEDEPSVQLLSEKYEFKSSGKWQHLFYKPNSNNLILLSIPQLTNFQKLTGVSFLFLLYSVLVLTTLAAFSLINRKKPEALNFRNRLNIAVISTLTTFLFLIGFSTIYYVGSEYGQKNIQAISEKIKSVLIELESKSNNSAQLYNDNDQLAITLNKLSNVFFTDIILYDLDGKLISSTRPRLFDIGLISDKMNSEACYSMQFQKKTIFVQNERIGKLSYLSAYTPLTNNKGETVAYLNLPYFAKQNGLQKEILTLLSALINIYVLLIIIAIAIALFISKKITEPFEVIGRNIKNVKLGKENEPIEWKSNDEIGRLVIEYNKMIQKLGESAQTLAKSERESAWREMAKQVAHEIKNPLTPMKLSVQHLQRSYYEKTPGWDKNIERMTRTLIEQIDTLAHIATEFSNFAKMPKANNEILNVKEVLMNVVELYSKTENCQIEFSSGDKNHMVFADREQIQRVFTNLIKNSIQSIPEERKGEIQIKINDADKNVVISIADNGVGIKDEMKDRIFTPNFTTKSTGMGLGLAMVKNIIESAGGSIWFETIEGSGTMFLVSIPIHQIN